MAVTGGGLYLLWERGVAQLQVLFGVRQDSLERAAEMLLIEVLRHSHQRRQRHGDLHLYSCKVLVKRATKGQSSDSQSSVSHPFNTHPVCIVLWGAIFVSMAHSQQ